MKEDKITIAKNYALRMKGQCLSDKYTHSHTKLKWQCENGHEWDATWYYVVAESRWCSKCVNENHTRKRLEEAKNHAISKGGQCLSNEYINDRAKMKWKCSNHNHKEWDSGWYSVVQANKWCTPCANENIKGKYRKLNGLEIAQNHAISKGGKCLSTEYINYDEKMEFICHNTKHQPFLANLDTLLCKGSWCPECVGLNQQEFRTRSLLNYLLDTDFIKVKLDWNINPKTGRLLELDGYSKELNMAFEYQGSHHFRQVFKESLEDVQERDLIKKQNCINNNVKLICINETDKIRKNSQNFLDDILLVLKENDIPIKKEIDMSIVDNIFMSHIITTTQEEQFKKSTDYAISKGGVLVSTEYVDSVTPLIWKCKNNHTFSCDYHHLVSRDRWCSICKENDRTQSRLDQLIKHATSKNGKCLSKYYENTEADIIFECSESHTFTSSFENVIRLNKWCPICLENDRKNKQLQKAQEYAKSKNGECLSVEYVSSKTKMKWKCEKNHIFEKTTHDIYLGPWCYQCYRENRKNKKNK